MQITTEQADQHTTRLVVVGELDLATAGHLHRAITAALTNDTTTAVVVDLDQVSFCDSSGIGTLIKAHTEAATHGAVVRVTNPRGAVRRVLEITGVLDVLTQPDRDRSYP